MLWTLLSTLVVISLVAFSYRGLRDLNELSSLAAPFLRRGAPNTTVELAGEDRRHEMAELNEATIEIGSRIERPGFLALRAAQAAFSLGALVALVQSIELLSGSGIWAAPLASFVGGCGGAVACRIIGRTAERRAQRLREAWSALIRRSARDVAQGEPGDGSIHGRRNASPSTLGHL